MRSDDDLLAHVRTEAARRRRRRVQAAVGGGAATVAVVVLLGVAAVATNGPDRDATTVHVDGGSTTEPATTPSTTPSTRAPATSATTSTTALPSPPTQPTPTTTVAPTAPPPPTDPPPVVDTRTTVTGGVTVTLTTTQDPARPLEVELAVRIRAGSGSWPSGAAHWGDGSFDEFGWGVTGCIVEEGDPPLAGDPQQGPYEETLVLTHTYGAAGGVEIAVEGALSFCTTDVQPFSATLALEVRG